MCSPRGKGILLLVAARYDQEIIAQMQSVIILHTYGDSSQYGRQERELLRVSQCQKSHLLLWPDSSRAATVGHI